MSEIGTLTTMLENIETAEKNRQASNRLLSASKILSEAEKEAARQRAKEIQETEGEVVVRSLPKPKSNWIVPVGLKEREPNLPISKEEALEIGANFLGKEQEIIRNVSRQPALRQDSTRSNSSRSDRETLRYDQVHVQSFQSQVRYELDSKGNPVEIGRLNVGIGSDIRPIETGFANLHKNARVTVSIEGVKESRKPLEEKPLVDSLRLYNDGVAVEFTRFKGQSLEFVGKQAIIDRKATKAVLTLVRGRNHSEIQKFPNGLVITCEPKIHPVQVGRNAIVPPTSLQVGFIDRTPGKIKDDKVSVFLSLSTGLVKCGQYETSSEALRIAMNALRETGEAGYVLFSSKVSKDGNDIDSGMNLNREKCFLNEDGSLKNIFVQRGDSLMLMRTSVIANEKLEQEPMKKKGPVMHVRKPTSTYVHGTKRAYSKGPWMRGA
jgi:hypothetical protein